MKKALILPALLLGLAVCGAIPFERHFEAAPDLAPRRQKLAKRLLMYPENQYKYGLFQNFLEGYIDRPLFYDRATRYKDKFAYSTAESFLRDAAIMQSYGFDGGGNLSTASYSGFVNAIEFYRSAPERIPGYMQFPQFSFGDGGRNRIDYEKSARVLRTARENWDIMPKINGKIPISVYNASYINLPAMKKFIDALHREFGDIFYLVCEIRIPPQHVSEFVDTGKWSEATQNFYRKRIDDILALYGGIQVRTFEDKRTLDYTFTPEFGIYDKYMEPMLMAALAKPENKDKIVVGYGQQGYINHMSGVNRGEYGTGRLRGIMNRLARINCDMIFFFEWNEFNENTCFQPTLYNHLVLQRLIRYYGNVMRGESPRPNPGDDLNLPPLALSCRETLKLGEVLRLELLNIPDTRQSAAYTAVAELLDANGSSVIKFPVEKFDRAKLDCVTYSVPSELLADHTVLNIRLTVSGADGKPVTREGFQYIRILPTFCYNYKSVRHSLRDILVPVQVEFSAVASGKNKYRIKGKISADEQLASLEVTDFGRELFAVDKANEFDRSKYEIFYGSIDTRRSKRRSVELLISGTDDWDFREWGFPNVTLNMPKRDGCMVASDWPVWSSENRFILKIAKADVAKTVIGFCVDDELKKFNAADIMKYGEMAHAFPRCRLYWRHCHEMPDIPVRINEKSAAFDTVVTSVRPYPILQLRAVTVSGKIYRSAPIIPKALPPQRVKINVFSESTGKVVPIHAKDALVPKLDWQISTAAGDMLLNSFDPYFRCDLGGGYSYRGAYHATPVPPGRHAPKVIQENGKQVLDFDGSTYLHFPLETFPRGQFTLRFSLKPEVDAKNAVYTIFRHFDRILGSVTIYSSGDKLCFAMGTRQLNTHRINTGFALPRRQYSDVEIHYDLQELTVNVNGAVRKFPLDRALALYFKPAIFGGHTIDQFGLPAGAVMFKGKVRSIGIEHK